MQIAEVIKYEGDNKTFIWKHPSEDFNTLTQLIVHENQEAIFMMNGQALDLFGPGRYTLETQNIPLVSKLINRTMGGDSPFHCEVYFVNKTEQMAILWGTDSKVQFMEPTYQFPIEIGACGEMSLKADDSKKLLLKLVGTESLFNQEQLIKDFRAFLMTKVKSYLAKTIKEQAISIFEMDEHLEELSEALRTRLKTDFEDYGMSLERFFVTTVMRPDDDPSYKRFKELHFRQYADIAEAKLNQQVDIIHQQTEAQKLIIESQAIAQKRAQEGYTYAQERSFDVAGTAAANEAIGQYTNLGVGLGTMVGVGGAVGGMMNESLSGAGFGQPVAGAAAGAGMQQPAAGQKACQNCRTMLPAGSKFCPECGTKQEPEKNVCPNCGTDVTGFKFCPTCGEKLS